jgi:hypothetical protein
MTTSRMGIMGNFLVSNFSLTVVTYSPEHPSCVRSVKLLTTKNPAQRA